MPMFLDLPVWYDDDGETQEPIPLPSGGSSGQYLRKGTGSSVSWSTISEIPGWASHYITAAETGSSSGWCISFRIDVPYSLVPPEQVKSVNGAQPLLYYLGFHSIEQTLPCSGQYGDYIVWGLYVDPSMSDGFCICYGNREELWVDDCSVFNDNMQQFGTADV